MGLLLDCMVYSEDEQILLKNEQHDSSIPDDDQDIEPKYYKSRTNEFSDEDDEEETYSDDDFDDDYNDDTDYSNWNIRKCAAATLDSLAQIYRADLLPVFIPIIQQRMKEANHWSIQESIILAIGAVGKGCYRSLTDYLPELMPFLFQQLKSTEVSIIITSLLYNNYLHFTNSCVASYLCDYLLDFNSFFFVDC